MLAGGIFVLGSFEDVAPAAALTHRDDLRSQINLVGNVKWSAAHRELFCGGLC